MMTYVLWSAQILLALAFLVAGATHAFRYDEAKRRMPWVSAMPKGLVRIIGFLEVLGAVGLILPAVTGVFLWLTPLAAAGLALVMISAIVFHLARSEGGARLSANGLLLALAVFVAVGRYMIGPL
jgi:uncharacterized membrane protein